MFPFIIKYEDKDNTNNGFWWLGFHTFTHPFTVFFLSISCQQWLIDILKCTGIALVMYLWIIGQWSIVVGGLLPKWTFNSVIYVDLKGEWLRLWFTKWYLSNIAVLSLNIGCNDESILWLKHCYILTFYSILKSTM